MRLLTASLTVAFTLAPHVALADFTPVNSFAYSAPGYTPASLASNASASDVQSVLAQHTLDGWMRFNIGNAVFGTSYVNQNFLIPLAAALRDVQTAEGNKDSSAARDAAGRAQALWTRLMNEKHPAMIWLFFANAGNHPQVVAYGRAFFDHLEAMKRSVEEAQQVAGRIEERQLAERKVASLPLDGDPGVRLLAAARRFEGTPYSKESGGMACSDLVIAAARDAGLEITSVPAEGFPRMTSTWFHKGLGSHFRQVAGGDDGVPLGALANEVATNKLQLPIGSVIVGSWGDEGHAALFVGVGRVNESWQLITYDANNAKSVTINFEAGVEVPEHDPTGIEFPGHQVGEHITRKQWGAGHKVKVFVPDPPKVLAPPT